jgi:central kinetochore subunit Mis15/CHL4
LSGEVSEGQKKRKSGSSGLENALQAEDTASSKRRKLMAEHRFGTSAIEGDGKGIERLDIRIEDAYPTMTSTSDGDSDNEVNPSSDSEVQATQDAGNAQPRRAPRRRTSILDQNHAYEDDDAEPATSTGWKPEILLTFHGSHVFAGIRHLVEAGVVDGVKMPGWMTGENGVSIGTVKDGRILGNKGSGLS